MFLRTVQKWTLNHIKMKFDIIENLGKAKKYAEKKKWQNDGIVKFL